jgi:hypothetical protein
MNDFIMYYWLVPALVTWFLYLGMIRHDGLTIDDLDAGQLCLMVILSVVWPIGALALTMLVVDTLIERWNND